MKENTYNTITKADAKKLNQKQTVLIETITSQVEKKDGTKDDKVTTNIYLNNSPRRREAFYNMYEGNFKPSKKKDEVKKEYHLKKLFKVIAEIGEKGAKEGIKFWKAEDYGADPVKEVATKAEEIAPAEEVVAQPDEVEEK
jgi:hypothetical protein